MLNWIKNKKITILITLLGAVLGFAYWYFVGCASGSCGITSVWWRSTLYGAFMGFLLSDLSFKQTKNESKNEE